MIVGIDATNLRRGGGITHLVELLRALQPERLGIKRVVVWGGRSTLSVVEDRPWLEKRNPTVLDKGLLHRFLWQRFSLSKSAREVECDVLFVPGGNYLGNFHPFVTMSRNLLPFEYNELARYKWSLLTLKLILLRFIMSRTYRCADGVIFLTKYAQKVVFGVLGNINGRTQTIPHGLNPRFFLNPKPQLLISDFSEINPFRIIYVSIIDQYKHQEVVVEAVSLLRKEGIPLILELVGPAYPPALKRLEKAMLCYDPNRLWVRYYGSLPFDKLHLQYAKANLGIFASSCENMPNILLETMASGLPIASSNRGPMPEILGPEGIYFNPESSTDIAITLRKLIMSPCLRNKVAKVSHGRAQQYSWELCAEETFRFLIAFKG
jgi:glycosyltransferase involved in cell wall biosynthesis